MNEETNIQQVEQKESIKFSKNAKGDYQWEIKVFIEEDKGNGKSMSAIDRIEMMNMEMRKRFESITIREVN